MTNALGSHLYNSQKKSGLEPQCKSCVAERAKIWAARPEVKERNRAKGLAHSRTPYRKRQIIDYQRSIHDSGLSNGRRHKIAHKYGLSPDRFIEIFKSQGGRCATCNIEFNGYHEANVDHCHATNVVRGLLCAFCNRALGQVRDSVAVLRNMIVYLGGKI